MFRDFDQIVVTQVMAKPKQRQLVKGASGPDMSEEDSWVIVKKQRVTIWIPPLPVTEDRVVPEPPEENQQLPKTRKATTNQPQSIIEDSDSETEKSMPPIIEKAIPNVPKLPAPNLPRLDHRTKLDQRVHNITRRKIIGVCNYPKVRNLYRSFLIGDGSLNKGLRARNLERKIQRAGGLSRWLLSLGLDQFVNIFQGKIVGKFQLANLTMKKLKDMGADAVGPRRKLMHAIDCLCQPYCFQAI